MATVILDDELRAKLNGLNEVVPVCEPDGKVVGHFLPEDLYLKYVMAWAKAEFGTPEAAREREAALADYRAGRVMTTAQAIEHLKGLGTGARGHELPGALAEPCDGGVGGYLSSRPSGRRKRGRHRGDG